MSQELINLSKKNYSDLPWRKKRSLYNTLVSEIMLQQTTVVTVKPYFEKFVQKWPTVYDLAESDQEAVLTQWAGLGYYSRARNLLKTAQIVVKDFKGVFPDDIKTLKSFPGIGDYTANAIRAIAFDKPATVVDGNVERVISRLFLINTPLPKAKKEIEVIEFNYYLFIIFCI